jgi:hypothetical protein
VVKREEDESILLKSIILVEDAYERQGGDYLPFSSLPSFLVLLNLVPVLCAVESIIMWRERCSSTNQDVDYALSFQETGGCYAIWFSSHPTPLSSPHLALPSPREAILDVQALSYNLLKPSNDHDQYDLQYSLSPEQSQESASLYLGLPTVSFENLDDIKLKITSCFNSQREVYASLILDHDGQYLRTLLTLSQESEQNEQFEICGR